MAVLTRDVFPHDEDVNPHVWFNNGSQGPVASVRFGQILTGRRSPDYEQSRLAHSAEQLKAWPSSAIQLPECPKGQGKS